MKRAHLKPLFVLLSALIAARVLFILLMPHVYSRDLYSWLHVMDVLEAGGNPYGQTEVLNWPPFWMQILFGIHQVSKHTGIAPVTGIQTVLITCEALVLCIAYFTGRRFFDNKKLFPALLFGLAINPVSIFLSCQHCNYDVFVGLWVLLTTWMLIEFCAHGGHDAWLMACFFTGMGILTKTVPVILTPLLFIHFRALPFRTKAFGAMLLGAPFIIGMSVLFALEPHGVLHNVVGYRSLGGWYGITGLMWITSAYGVLQVYQKLSPVLFLSAIAFTAWKSYHTRLLSPQQVLTSVLLLMLFIPTFGPGYSPPYALWYLPVAVLLYAAAGRPLQKLMLAGWIICVITYTAEYALLGSHGAFLAKWFPTKRLLYMAENFGGRVDQTLIRLPLFLFYLYLFFALVRSLRRRELQGAVTIPQQGAS